MCGPGDEWIQIHFELDQWTQGDLERRKKKRKTSPYERLAQDLKYKIELPRLLKGEKQTSAFHVLMRR